MFRRLALLLPAIVPLALRAQPPACDNTPIYTPCEMVFELPETASKPYETLDLRIEFRSPRHRTVAMPAFWDGGRRMVVRFAPTEAGAWDYHVTSNNREWNDKTGTFNAASADVKGFIRPANKHHWAYTERSTAGLDQAHLWMGSTELLFATMDEAAFRSMADARAGQKFTHVRGLVLAGPEGGAFENNSPSPSYFQRLDSRIRYLNSKGIVVDLVIAGGQDTLTRLQPGWQDRQRFLRYLVARYAPMNITWQGVENFESYADGRALLKEVGTVLKETDPYGHPRSSGARVTSSPLVDDGWMDYITYHTGDDAVGAIEHQLYGKPFVNLDFGHDTGGDPAGFRRKLWNAYMNGQYPTYNGPASDPNAPGAKAMSVWYNFLDDTRYWELEPYFDVSGGKAVALEDIEYVVYLEKPSLVELTVEKHGYDVYWVNPADGEATKAKKYSGEHFTGEPPDKSHDWVLHVVREGRVSGMNKSYKFESREIVLQEIEANSPKVPFVIEAPKGDLSLSVPAPYAAKITRESRATRAMLWLWLGEVAADHQGYRVLATAQKGEMKPPRDIARNYPAIMHLRLYGMNANGKVYELDSACGINP